MSVAADALRASCTQCGLPVRVAASLLPQPIYCCHACRLVAGIVGDREQGARSWNLLRLGLGALLAMNIMMISLLLYSSSIEAEQVPLFHKILLALSTFALVLLLPPFLLGRGAGPTARSIRLDALIAGGSLAAFTVSAVSTLRGSGEVYFDTATMLPVLVTLGNFLEAQAKSSAADLLHSLETLLPERALYLGPHGSAEVALDQLRQGDLIRVRPGERIAVDGVIVEGNTTVEEASFTGECLPRECQPGDRVIAGAINGAGTMVVKAEKTGAGLLLHGIIALVADAWANPSEAERIAEKAAKLFIPAVLATAAGSLAFWALLGEPARGGLSALSVLVVACPCSIGIATSLATSLAIARAAQAGIIVRGGRVMEQMATTDIIYFDKTGTVTLGRPTLEKISILDPQVSEGELLGRLAALEAASEHPLGKAVVAAARSAGIEEGSAARVQIHPGSGLEGAVSWGNRTTQVRAGSAALVRSGSHPLPEAAESFTPLEVAWDGRVRGRLLFADPPRSHAGACMKELGQLGISCVLLSGDRLGAARALAQEIGIKEVEAPRNPAQKLQVITAALAQGKGVAMVGDGINDAPSLAAAQTGIAIGAGQDLARQAGNVVILSNRLLQIPWLIQLSIRTRKIIRGNFAWSFGYNAVALAAAAAGLLHPLLAALAMAASSVTVLGNSLRILNFAADQPSQPVEQAQCPGSAAASTPTGAPKQG